MALKYATNLLSNESKDETSMLYILKNYKEDNLSSHQKSLLHYVTSQINNDGILDALYLGMLLSHDKEFIKDNILNISQKCDNNILLREYATFNNYILTVLDVKSFPLNIKNNCTDYNKLIEYIDEYMPSEFYPCTIDRKNLMYNLKFNNLEDIMKFNHEFKRIFNYIVDYILGSKFYEKLSKFNMKPYSNNKNKFSNNINGIYRTENIGSKYISIDVIQSNATFLFLFIGLSIVDSIEDFGLGLEKIYKSKNEMRENFCWNDLIKIIMQDYPNDKIIDKDLFNVLVVVIGHSKSFRQIILGIIGKKMPPESRHTVCTMWTNTCYNTMIRLATSIEENVPNCNIVAVSNDEIIIKGDNDTLKNYFYNNPIGDDSYIAKTYTKIEEFVVKQYTLKSNKSFYAKYITNKLIPIIRQIEPSDKLEALEIVSNDIKFNISK